MNLTASHPILVEVLNEVLLRGLPVVSNPTLNRLPNQFEVESFVLLENDKRVHGRTEVGKAFAQADQIQIVLTRRQKPSGIADSAPKTPPASTIGTVEPSPANPQLEIVDAFHRAKRSHRFVALKWFRDQWLPQQDFTWCRDPGQIRTNLRTAIDQGTLRKELLPNPNNPEYPTTTLQEGNSVTVSSVAERGKTRRFAPIRIAGRPLSISVIEGR